MAADDASGLGRVPTDPSAAADRRSGEVSRVGGQQERYGPLAIARYRKDDGRSLLLYRHADADLG